MLGIMGYNILNLAVGKLYNRFSLTINKSSCGHDNTTLPPPRQRNGHHKTPSKIMEPSGLEKLTIPHFRKYLVTTVLFTITLQRVLHLSGAVMWYEHLRFSPLHYIMQAALDLDAFVMACYFLKS